MDIIYGRYIKGDDIVEVRGEQYITVMNAKGIIDRVANDVREIVEQEHYCIADDFRTVLDLLTAWAPIVERDGFNFIIREQLVDLLKTLGDKYEVN